MPSVGSRTRGHTKPVGGGRAQGGGIHRTRRLVRPRADPIPTRCLRFGASHRPEIQHRPPSRNGNGIITSEPSSGHHRRACCACSKINRAAGARTLFAI